MFTRVLKGGDVTAAAPARSRLAGAALLISGSFVVSRVLGLMRNVVIADVFGNSRATDAYFAAFRIPDTMYALVSGGALASAFIPVFAGLVERGDEDEAWSVASTVANTVLLVLTVLAVIAWILTPQIMNVLVSGYTPSEREVTVTLTRIMLLQPILLGVQAVASAILQTYHRFVLTALGPLIYSASAIVGGLLARQYGVAALAWSVVIGAALYLGVQLPGMLPERDAYLRAVRNRFFNWEAPAAREVLHLFGPRVIGLAAFQAMLLITQFLASGLPTGTLSAINFAWVLIWFPVSALGTAAATAIFPTLSRLHAADDVRTMRITVFRSLRLVVFLAIPAATGLIVLRRPIINLLYLHGTFTHHDTEQTAFALLFYALALPSLAAIEVLPRVFYAMRDTATPVRIAVVAVAIDAVLSIIFVHSFPRASGQGGLALATAVASTLQAFWLGSALGRSVGGIGGRAILQAARDAALASLAMGLVLYIALDPLTAIFPQSGFGVLVTTALCLGLGLGVFYGAAKILGAPEVEQVRAMLPGQKGRGEPIDSPRTVRTRRRRSSP